MTDRINELLYRNLQEVFGEGDAKRRRATIRSFTGAACSTRLRVYSSGTMLSTHSLGNFAQRTRILPTRRTVSLRLCTTLAAWRGVWPAGRGPPLYGRGCDHRSR